MDEKVIVARPSDGSPVVLAATAALVWSHLDMLRTLAEIDAHLAAEHPEIGDEERATAVEEIVTTLGDEDLLDRD